MCCVPYTKARQKCLHLSAGATTSITKANKKHNVIEVGESEEEEEVEEEKEEEEEVEEEKEEEEGEEEVEEAEKKKSSPVAKVLSKLALPFKSIGKCKTTQLSAQLVKDREAESSQRTCSC